MSSRLLMDGTIDEKLSLSVLLMVVVKTPRGSRTVTRLEEPLCVESLFVY